MARGYQRRKTMTKPLKFQLVIKHYHFFLSLIRAFWGFPRSQSIDRASDRQEKSMKVTLLRLLKSSEQRKRRSKNVRRWWYLLRQQYINRNPATSNQRVVKLTEQWIPLNSRATRYRRLPNLRDFLQHQEALPAIKSKPSSFFISTTAIMIWISSTFYFPRYGSPDKREEILHSIRPKLLQSIVADAIIELRGCKTQKQKKPQDANALPVSFRLSMST